MVNELNSAKRFILKHFEHEIGILMCIPDLNPQFNIPSLKICPEIT
jgi:hypothetical protein